MEMSHRSIRKMGAQKDHPNVFYHVRRIHTLPFKTLCNFHRHQNHSFTTFVLLAGPCEALTGLCCGGSFSFLELRGMSSSEVEAFLAFSWFRGLAIVAEPCGDFLARAGFPLALKGATVGSSMGFPSLVAVRVDRKKRTRSELLRNIWKSSILRALCLR